MSAGRFVDLIRAAGTVGPWALLDRPALSRWSHGRICLLGDAAHPMFPIFGQGAAQPQQQRRALAFVAADPLLDNGWIYGYDPEAELAAPPVSPPSATTHTSARLR
jgi:salicylate hydroxylase